MQRHEPCGALAGASHGSAANLSTAGPALAHSCADMLVGPNAAELRHSPHR